MMAKSHKSRETNATALALWAGAGHDLRQPIQSLLLMTHMMALTEDGEKRKLTARSMEHALQMLQGMIGDLARIARMEADNAPAPIADVAVHKMLMRAAEQNAALARAYGLSISCEPAIVIARLDERLTAEIVGGLLRNAIALAKGGGIGVKASAHPKGVDVEIAFDGPVPAATQMNTTFAELAGADAGSKPTPGFKMLKVLARQMSASISLASRTEARQVLTVSFPNCA